MQLIFKLITKVFSFLQKMKGWCQHFVNGV